MLVRFITFTILFMAASSAFAADIYGRVWMASDKKAAIGGKVYITCVTGKYRNSSIDRHGRYRVTKLPPNKRCTGVVKYKKIKSKSLKFFTGASSRSTNIELRRSGKKLIATVR